MTGIALVMLLAACGSNATAEAEVPAGPVVDLADILPAPMEDALDKRLRAYWEDKGNALVVASIGSLGNQTIEEVAFDLFNEWGIGDDKTHRGILLLVAPNDRMVRIEVGCGVETIITNSAAAEVIAQDIIPLYRQGQLAEGTVAGVDALIQRLDAGRDPGPVSQYCRELMKKAA